VTRSELGSLTKEVPLKKVDQTITAITPGMNYKALLEFARNNTNGNAPGLLSKRFLLIRQDGRIIYDEFLSLVAQFGIDSPIVRNVMLFVWAYRDERIREFILTKVADQQGKWSLGRIRNKTNAKFFETWYSKGPSAKARSNFEYFLVE